MERNNPKVINAWCMYDWANSVYSLTITSAIFPVYYNQITREVFKGDVVKFFGFEITNTVLFSYALSMSFFIVACLSPLLSGMADSGGIRKRMLQIFTWIGSLSCVGLFFFTGENIEYGIILSILASTGWAGAMVFYNAFLPEITTEEQFDKVSAKGFSMGYIGSVIQLVLSLVIIMNYESFGITDSFFAPRLSFLTVGVWWIGFAYYSFYYLPSDSKNKEKRNKQIFSRGYKELRKVFTSIKKDKPIKRFLTAFFFYNMGVQTVMLLAAIFGEKELKMGTTELIGTILLLQLVAIGGAYLFAFISKKIGNKSSITIMVVIWIFICIAAFFTRTEMHFYLIATAVGVVMGGIQSLSRSTYSKLIPKDSEDNTSYFSFYDVTDKVSVVIGTFSYGFIEYMTESMRFSALALGGFFILGLVFIIRFQMPKKVENPELSVENYE